MIAAKDELLTMAQIAVALIGFSGLIFVFRVRDVSELEVRDLAALGMIVGSGSVTLVFSLVPLPLAYLGLPEPIFWRLCSGLFAAGMFAAAAVFTAINRQLSRSGHVARTPRLNRVTLVSTVAAGVVLVLCAVGALPPNPAIYLIVLVMGVLLCLAYVSFMLVVARRSTDL